MKKILITIMLSMFFVGLYCTSAYASSEFENKYWGVDSSGYARYGHIILNGSDFQVFMVMLDNGEYQRFMPLVYSKNSQTITLNVKGNHTKGDLDIAKSLTDYYDENYTLGCYELFNINNELDGYIYYLNSNFSIMEYMTMNYIEFETNGPKYYYFESDADLYSSDTYVKVLNALLSGGLSDFVVTDGSISKISNYTLEPPLNIQVSNQNQKNIKITWEQSDGIDVSNWYTEFYIQQTGTYKKSFFSSKKKFDTDFIYFDNVLNHYKIFKFNALSLKNTENYLKELLTDLPQVQVLEKTNIMMRNVFDDGKGNIYYSDYVYLFQDENYDYIANEIDGETFDKDGLSSSNIDSNIKTDSEIYDNSNINDISDEMSNGNAIGIMKGLLNDVKDFPQFIYEFFSFMPSEIFLALSAFLIILIPIALIKIVV